MHCDETELFFFQTLLILNSMLATLIFFLNEILTFSRKQWTSNGQHDCAQIWNQCSLLMQPNEHKEIHDDRCDTDTPLESLKKHTHTYFVFNTIYMATKGTSWWNPLNTLFTEDTWLKGGSINKKRSGLCKKGTGGNTFGMHSAAYKTNKNQEKFVEIQGREAFWPL